MSDTQGVARTGALTLRRAGRLYHLKVGAAHARRRVLAIVDEQEVMVVALDTGEILSTHRIEPDKGTGDVLPLGGPGGLGGEVERNDGAAVTDVLCPASLLRQPLTRDGAGLVASG